MFLRVGHNTSLTYIGNETVIGAPRMIVELVEGRVREVVRNMHGIEEWNISSISVYELRFEVRFLNNPLR